MRIFSFRNIRILLLLTALAAAALYTKDQRLVTQGWYRPIDVVVYPINVDSQADTNQYINNLRIQSFAPIEKFFNREGKRYQIIVDTPVIVHLESQLHALPPTVPDTGSSAFANIIWSLKMRWWAYRHAKIPDGLDSEYTIRTFLLLQNPGKNPILRHSIGMQKGLMTLVHAFADKQYNKQNNIIMTHEILHTFGASDKYSPETNQPIYPQGFADAERAPLYPQRKAEIMAVKRPIREGYAEMPDSLKLTTVNAHTAREIGWLNDESS